MTDHEDVTTLVPLLNNKYQKTGLELKKKGWRKARDKYIKLSLSMLQRLYHSIKIPNQRTCKLQRQNGAWSCNYIRDTTDECLDI